MGRNYAGGGPCWSELLPEILNLIVQNLCLFSDYLTFGQVCKSWRCILLDRNIHTRPPPCILQIGDGRTKSEMPLWVLHGGRLLKLRSRARFHFGERIVGSSEGWLVVAFGFKAGMHVMNPMSNERIRLPSKESSRVQLQSSWSSEDVYTTEYHVISDHPSGFPSSRRPRMTSCYLKSSLPRASWLPVEPRRVRISVFVVTRVVISSSPTTSDCVLFASGLYKDNYSDGFMWCRVGDEQWSPFPWPTEVRFMDSMFYGGKLYGLGSRGELIIYAFDPEPKIVVKSCITSNACNFNYWQFVESDREILALGKNIGEDYIFSQWASITRPSNFRKEGDGDWKSMFRQEGDGQWARVESMGNRILLKGRHGVASIYTEDLIGSEFEACCIYYGELKFMSEPALMKFSPAAQRFPRHQCVSSFPRKSSEVPEIEWIISPAW